MKCEERTDRTDGSEICLAAFLLYGSPMMLTGAYVTRVTCVMCVACVTSFLLYGSRMTLTGASAAVA